MIISKERKFIFIHIPKTAGTSISKLLKDLFPKTEQPLLTHISARHALSYLESQGEDPSDYQFFTFVRNPYERMHSLYHFIKRRWPQRLDNKDLNKWLFSNEEIYDGRQTTPGEFPVPNTQKPQLDWLTISQCTHNHNTATIPRIIPNFIGRYENLREDLEDILYQLGLGTLENISDVTKLHLPQLQDYHRDKNYRKYFNGQGKEWVERFFEVDLDYFGYRF